MRCAYIVAMGGNAERAAGRLTKSLRAFAPTLDIVSCGSAPIPHANSWCTPAAHGIDADPGARRVKLSVFEVCAGREQILYLDADTLVRGPINGGFDLLDNGFEVVLALSVNQQDKAFAHVTPLEYTFTVDQHGFVPNQYQCGVMYLRRTPSTVRFFSKWLDEFERFSYYGKDQAAFARILHDNGIRVALLGRAYNGGEYIAHNFGEARA